MEFPYPESGSNEWLNNLYGLELEDMSPIRDLSTNPEIPSKTASEFAAISELYGFTDNKPAPLNIKPGSAIMAQGEEWHQASDFHLPDESVALAKGSEMAAPQEKPYLVAEGDGLVFVVHDPQTSTAGMVKMPLAQEEIDNRTDQLLDKMVDSLGPLSSKAHGFVCSPKDFSPGETDFWGPNEEPKSNTKQDSEHFKGILSEKTGLGNENITTVDDGYWQKVEVDPETGDVFVSSFAQESVDAVTIAEIKRYSYEQLPAIENHAVQPFLGQKELNNVLPFHSKFLNQPVTKLDIWLKPAEGVKLESLELSKYNIRPSSILNTNPESDEVCVGFDLIQENCDQPAGHISLKMDRGFVQITDISKASNTPDQQVDAIASLCEASLTVAKASEYRVAIIDPVEMANNATEQSYNTGWSDDNPPERPLNFDTEAYRYYTEMYADVARNLGFQKMDGGLWRRALS
jgi:hypothetical protein